MTEVLKNHYEEIIKNARETANRMKKAGDVLMPVKLTYRGYIESMTPSTDTPLVPEREKEHDHFNPFNEGKATVDAVIYGVSFGYKFVTESEALAKDAMADKNRYANPAAPYSKKLTAQTPQVLYNGELRLARENSSYLATKISEFFTVKDPDGMLSEEFKVLPTTFTMLKDKEFKISLQAAEGDGTITSTDVAAHFVEVTLHTFAAVPKSSL